MPCSCFGKKDKKGGVLGEEEKYRPRDSRERDPPAPAPVSADPVTQSQSQPLLGDAPTPPAPGTPPSPSLATPTPGGDARLRPEDDPDKATRRRDVVASFYSDQCELIGFKATGSRPPSAHVGGQQDGPAATSSPATSSPSSTRSGAFCRADLAEKRREFFRDLTLDDDDNSRGGSRPTSRLTDPGSQQTPRHSHYQDQLHHTLPHLNKTSPRSNKFSTTPLVFQHSSLHRNSTSTPLTSNEETQPLLHSSPEQEPKILPKKPDHSLSEIPKHPSNEVVSDSEIYLYDSDETPLLSDKEMPSDIQMMPESSVSTTVQHFSPEIAPSLSDQSSLEIKEVIEVTESKRPELLVDISPTELNIDKSLVNNREVNVIFPTEPTESSKVIVDSPSIEGQQLIYDNSTSENSKLFDFVLQESPLFEESTANTNSQVPVFDISTSQSPQLILDAPCTGSEEIKVNIPSPESPQNVDIVAVDSQLITDNTQVISGSPKVDPFVQFDSPFVVESHSVESPQSFDNQFNVEFSHEPFPQTLPVIINETLKEPPKEHEPHKEHEEHTNFENTPQNTHMFTFENPIEQTPQTIVETTRQFISGSPDEQKTSQTIVETTRQFITGPPEDQTSQTILETTQQFISESPPEEQKSSHTIVETTRQYISGMPEDEETQNLLESAQQFLSGSPDQQTIVKTTQKFVSSDPDDQFTRTVVQTTQQIVSGNPDEERTQTTVETTQQSFPTSVDPFFLTSVEEPDELPEKLLVQTGATTTIVTQPLEKPVAMPRSQLDDVLEEEKEEPILPDVPCFGAPPPPSSPPPPLPEGHVVEDPFTSPIAVVIPPGEEELLPPAPPTPPAEQHQQAAPLLEEQQHQFEADPAPLTPPSPPIPHEEKEDLPPAPPTPPTPRLEDVQLLPSKPSPMENEQLPPTPPTPHREDELPPAPLTPPKEDHNKLLPAPPKEDHNEVLPTPPKEDHNKVLPAPGSAPAPPTITSSPAVTCGVEIVSSSTLEDDGIGSEIDDAIETLEGLSEEGNIARAAASS